MRQIARAARNLVDERFLLPEDAERIIEETKRLPLVKVVKFASPEPYKNAMFRKGW